ncbi:biopolymer transporter ExbD [Variovorax sp. PCZ-1]|uniref:ExbD/TolR family protein n=1 Tax=Variovorax sp. PCZ-1 TaxID=2835533 RepID=UPI001BCDEFD2|nr:biopolymer transporter ExbD [Variovorax sp. PCZ-1]MBS7806092.1 biopolymer transporter ExbD [Variovorax sp. PCZ-1]
MALSLQNTDSEDDGWLAEINTTPLVDVMLVLLIIFLLTVPVVSASVQLKLPVQTAQQQDTSGDYVIISIDAAGRLYLNDNPAPDVASLQAALVPAVTRDPRPQLHIRADGDAPYAAIAPIIDLAQGMGWPQISLLTEQSPQDRATINTRTRP